MQALQRGKFALSRWWSLLYLLGRNCSRAAVPRKGAVLHFCGLPASLPGAGAFISCLNLVSYWRYCNHVPIIVRWSINFPSTPRSHLRSSLWLTQSSVLYFVLLEAREWRDLQTIAAITVIRTLFSCASSLAIKVFFFKKTLSQVKWERKEKGEDIGLAEESRRFTVITTLFLPSGQRDHSNTRCSHWQTFQPMKSRNTCLCSGQDYWL